MRNNRIRLLAGIGSAVILLVATGCQSTKDERSEGTIHDDNQITSSIERSLDTDPAFKFPNVNVSTYAGVVQLSGFVSIQGQKDRAQQLAQNTAGARKVINGISIKPQLAATGGPAPVYEEVPVRQTVVTAPAEPAPADPAPAAPAQNAPEQNSQNQNPQSNK